MKKVSKRTKKFMTSPGYTTSVFNSRKNGLTKILNFLAKGTRVQASEGAVGFLAAQKQLF